MADQNDQFELVTPLGPKVMLFARLAATEALSQVSTFEFEWLSEKIDIDLDKILGKRVSLRMALPDQRKRFFTGYVTRLSHVGTRGRYQAYQATVRPWLWFLSRTADCRIFQGKSVPDIIKAVFADHAALSEMRNALKGSYQPWEYCVQYRESDLDFVCRLMEQEGIYFYFEHAENKNVLVLADSYSAHAVSPGYEQLDFVDSKRAMQDELGIINEWSYARQVQPGKTTLADFDFIKPSVKLESSAAAAREHAEGKHEVYDYPGEFSEKPDGGRYAQVRIDELQAQFELASAHTNARGIMVGHLFKLQSHLRKDQNREYLVTAATTSVQTAGFESGVSQDSSFECDFTALNSQQDYRPPRVTPKPVVGGPQTAIVVGPSGDEIYTDQYGRVKVQFHWDRYGKKDENSSCWVRVSHPWAGKNWGFVAVPRIGQEVVIDFLEGDPDRPLITGRVYNAEQMPPYALPANKTQTGVLTRSSSGGSGATANELRFEDKKGSEQVYLHAEKNQDISVENDETHSVGHDRTKTIDHDETTHVKHDRTETVDNNETITIGVDRSEKVGSNETIVIGVNRTESVGANETISIGANRDETVGASQSVTIGATDTLTVATQRTHTVGVNETITIGAAQEVTVGAAQVVTIGANQTTSIGANQSINVGANQSNNIGSNLSVSVGADLGESVGGNHALNVGGNLSASAGKDAQISAGKNFVIDAADSITIQTGSASITMKKDGTITIKGKDISLEGSGKIQVKASGDVIVKGSKITNN